MRDRSGSTDKKQQFGIWLGLPEEAKEPKTQEGFGRQFGVTPETLSRWKKDPIVLKAKANAVKLFYCSGPRLAAFMKSIDQGLEECKPQTQRLFAEMAGLLNEEKGPAKGAPIEFMVRYATKERNTD